jgi:hypothetical protein
MFVSARERFLILQTLILMLLVIVALVFSLVPLTNDIGYLKFRDSVFPILSKHSM